MSIRSGGSLKEEKWVHSAANLQIVDDTNSLLVLEKGKCNGYGRSAVAAGRAEWKVRIDFESFGGITVGLWRHNLRDKSDLDKLPLEDAFTDFENGYGYNSKTSMIMHKKERKRYGKRWKRGDELTMSLDLTARCLSFAINGEALGVAYDSLPMGAYRLACKLQFPEQKFSILEFWTSLDDDFATVPSDPGTEIEVTKPCGEEEDLEISASAAQSPFMDDGLNPSEVAAVSAAAVASPVPVVDVGDEEVEDEDVPSPAPDISPAAEEEEQEINDEHADDIEVSESVGGIDVYDDEEDEKKADAAGSTSSSEDSFVKEDLGVEDEDDLESTQKNKHDRSYSITEMKDVLVDQKRSSLTTADADADLAVVSEESVASAASAGARSRSLSSSVAPTPVIVPDRVEIALKEDENDFFAHSGPDMSVEDSKVTMVRDRKGRCSAFGGQLVTTGRMEWMLRIEKGNKIRLGVCGVTNNTDSDFSQSQFGFGYGDDGNIYFSNSSIEFGDGFKDEDIVGVYLDMDQGTLRFTVNGEDHGEPFEDLKVSEDDGVFGYRLAISMAHRNHSVILLESTIWNTKQYSPRPVSSVKSSHGRRKSATSLFPLDDEEKSAAAAAALASASSIGSDETAEDGDASADPVASPKPKKKKPKKKKGSDKDKGPKGKKKKPSKKGTDEAPKKKKPGSKKKKPGSEGGSKKKPTPAGGRKKKPSSGAVSSGKKKPGKKGPAPVKKPRVARSPGRSPRPAKSPRTPGGGRSAMALASPRKKKKSVVWGEPKAIRDFFEYGGPGMRLDGTLVAAKNDIRDASSAFGNFTVPKKTKVEWEIRVKQGSQASIGIISAPESSIGEVRFSKLLAGFFHNDRSGFAYQGRDGGLASAGKYKRKYGASYKTGNVITVTLDTAAKTLSFAKDGESQGIAYKNIQMGTYRLAITFPKKWHSVEIASTKLFESAS